MPDIGSDLTVERRLAELGLRLPEAPRPVGSYRAAVVANDLLFISGQLPLVEGEMKYPGRIGAELSETAGGEAARLAALNVLAQIKAALGSFDRLVSLVRVEGYVSSAPGWSGQPGVLDHASKLFTAVLGDRGIHARSALATPQLPMNASVELVVTAHVRPAAAREGQEFVGVQSDGSATYPDHSSSTLFPVNEIHSPAS